MPFSPGPFDYVTDINDRTKPWWKEQWQEEQETAPIPAQQNGANRESLHKRKLGLHLLVPQFLEEMARVADFGGRKYGDYNWMKGLSIAETIGSLERHLSELKRGQSRDRESTLTHLGHIAANAMFLYWFMNGPRAAEYSKWDDRKFTEAAEMNGGKE